MDSVYRGGWEAEGGLNHPWAQGQSHCVFSETQKQPQWTSHAALLVHPSGTIWTVMNLQGQKNVACESRPGYLYWYVWIVLECGFHVKL